MHHGGVPRCTVAMPKDATVHGGNKEIDVMHRGNEEP
jgi:hypothetical protein